MNRLKPLLLLIPLSFLLLGQTFAKMGGPLFLLESRINWFLLLSYFCLILRGIIWIFVIRKFRLSYAYPVMSASYLLILFISWKWFGEIITRGEVFGAFLIISGIFLINLGEKNIES